MRYFLAFILLFAAAQAATAQSLTCTAGRALYARDYAILFSDYKGTAATVETCAAACEESGPENRTGCFIGACGLACLIIGMDNCIDYYTIKVEIDGRRDSTEALCEAEEAVDERADDLTAWSAAESRNNISAYESYLENCNSICAYKSEAENRLVPLYARRDEQVDRTAWTVAEGRDNILGYQHYLGNCNSICAYRTEAEEKLAPLYISRDQEAWERVTETGLGTDAQRYLNLCDPVCSNADEARFIISREEARGKRFQELVETQFLVASALFFGPIVLLGFL